MATEGIKMTKDFSDGNNDGKKEWNRESKDRGDRRSFNNRPRFSRDNDSRSDFRREKSDFSRDRDDRKNRDTERPRFSRENRDSRDFVRSQNNNDRGYSNNGNFRRDERDSREDRGRRDNRDFSRDRVNNRDSRDSRNFSDRPRFNRDNNQNRDRDTYRGTERPRFSRENERSDYRRNDFNRENSKYSSRDSKPYNDRPRFSRDNRDSRDSRDGNRLERFDRPRFAKNDRPNDHFSTERHQERRPRFERAFQDEMPQKTLENQQEHSVLQDNFNTPAESKNNALEASTSQYDTPQNKMRTDDFPSNGHFEERDAFHDHRRDSGREAKHEGEHNYGRGGFRDKNRDGSRDGFRDGNRSAFRDGNRDGSRSGFHDKNRDGGRGGFKGGFERTDLQEVLDLDKGILKLLAKRARFLQKLITGKMLDAATEKQIRTAWEEHASKLSRDPKVFRDLFLLVQSVEALSLGDTDQPFFNLSPAPKPVQVELPAPASSRVTRYYMTLAAASGKETSVKNVPLTDSIIDGLKSLNFMGGDLWYENDGTVMSRKAKGLERGADKAVHVGKDPLNLWLVLALSLGLPYHLKITGENELRSIDFMPIARFLPKLGARLVQIIPSQEGLPVRVEASGMLPEEVMLPADLPRDFVFALLLASTFWESNIRFNMKEYFDNLTQNPILQREWDTLFEELEDVFKVCDVHITLENTESGMCFICEKSEDGPSFTEEILVPSDAEICTTFFLLPAFTSGYVQLSGVWNHRGTQKMIKEIMDFAGLEWTEFDASARVKGASDGTINMPDSGEIPHCPVHISTLLYTICAERGMPLDLEKLFAHLPQMPHITPSNVEITEQTTNTVDENIDNENQSEKETTKEGTTTQQSTQVDMRHLIISFLAHIGYNEKMQKVEVDNSAWLAPSAAWAVAFSLGAYIRPRLKLVNPNILNDYYPFYWRMYNTLPNPELKKQERKHDKVSSSRKRVIAQGVYADLADIPQPNPDADADGY